MLVLRRRPFVLLAVALLCAMSCKDSQPPPEEGPQPPPEQSPCPLPAAPEVPPEGLCTLPAEPGVWQEGPSPLCLQGGWCFSYPTPQGFLLTDLVGASSSDLWASGEGRLLLHWDGSTYTARNSPAPGNIRALWRAGADDIWGVGDGGAIIHWDGQSVDPHLQPRAGKPGGCLRDRA